MNAVQAYADAQMRREKYLHTFTPEQVRGMFTPAKIRRTLRHLDTVPLVGSEKGDRAEIERIVLPAVALPISQPTIISKDFTVGDPWLAMRINLRGELNSVAAPTGTVKADAPLQLWALALSTDIDKDVVEASVSARALFRYSHFINGTQPELVAPTIVASTVTAFNAVVTLLFTDERLMSPMDSVLDTRRYQTVTLTITTGALTDIVTSPVNITLQNVFADIEIVRVSPRVPLPVGVAKVVPFYKRHAPIVPAGETVFQLDRIPTLADKRLAFFTSGGTEVQAGVPFTGAGSNGVLDTLRVFSNLRDHFGSPVSGVTRRTLQGGNKEDYSLEAWPAGWHVVDFVLDGSALSALATGDKSTLQAALTYQAGLPGTPQVSVLVAGSQKMRGTEAV